MFFQRVKTPGLGHNAYVLGCGEGLAVVIDPRRDVDEYLDLAQANGLTIAYVLETHRQEDFEFGSRTLAEMTGARIVGGQHELFGDIDIRLGDGEELTIGATRFVALATPGHTPESMSYAVYAPDAVDACWAVFSGDALFIGDAGRTDLPDPEKTADNAGLLYDCVHAKLAPLGEQTLLFPAHGAGSACGGNISSRDDSTLGIEMAGNPTFTLSRDEFIAHKLAEKMGRPPYFEYMEKTNLRGGRRLRDAPPRVLQPPEFAQRIAQEKTLIVIDTRTPDAFAGAHIAGAYNIWLDGLSAMAGWLADETSRLLLVVDAADEVEPAVLALARIGIDGVEGALVGGVEAWREQGFPIETIATTSAAQTAEVMNQCMENGIEGGLRQGHIRILDVRDQYEWDEKRIPGAIHAFVGDLAQNIGPMSLPPLNLPPLDKDGELIVHCSVGHRAGLAVSILQRHGFTRVSNMLGGLTAWEELGYPLERPAESVNTSYGG